MTSPNVVLDVRALKSASRVVSRVVNRPALWGPCVESDGTVTATDGHMLATFPPCAHPVHDWPCVASPNGGKIGERGVILAPEAVASALALAKVHSKDAAGLSGKVALTVAEGGGVEINAGRGGRIQAPTIDFPYPNWRAVLPKGEPEPVERIAFSVEYLKAVLTAFEDAGHETVSMTFRGPLSAVSIEPNGPLRESDTRLGRRSRRTGSPPLPMSGLIMPCRMG